MKQYSLTNCAWVMIVVLTMSTFFPEFASTASANGNRLFRSRPAAGGSMPQTVSQYDASYLFFHHRYDDGNACFIFFEEERLICASISEDGDRAQITQLPLTDAIYSQLQPEYEALFFLETSNEVFEAYANRNYVASVLNFLADVYESDQTSQGASLSPSPATRILSAFYGLFIRDAHGQIGGFLRRLGERFGRRGGKKVDAAVKPTKPSAPRADADGTPGRSGGGGGKPPARPGSKLPKDIEDGIKLGKIKSTKSRTKKFNMTEEIDCCDAEGVLVETVAQLVYTVMVETTVEFTDGSPPAITSVTTERRILGEPASCPPPLSAMSCR